MNHPDHVNLLRSGIPPEGNQTWADIGSGRGAFTLALADLLDDTSIVYSVDKDQRALQAQANAVQQTYPNMQVQYLQANFTKPLGVPPLDGIVMANSLHFVREKEPVLRHLLSYLKSDGHFILVEYNTNRGNRWVPYPLNFPAWQHLAMQVGLQNTQLLQTRPSRFLGEFFSALSIKSS